ncbi:MAG: hypothetical protein O7A66_08085 [Alphaproteobacteria bacterium]|nr:hypothetical protein [Alphaproteobacteria bacterium]
MTDHEEQEKPERKSLGGDLVLPIGAFIFTLYYFYTIIDVPRIAQVSAFFVGTILIFLLILLAIRIGKEVKAGTADLRLGRLVEPRSFIPKRLALFALTLGFIFFVEWLGFTLTVFAFLSLAMLLLSGGKKKGLAFSIAAILAFGGYLLFIVAFNTRFPAGPFEQLMEWLF